MSFVRNDLMLRHGRLKHKANLKKPPEPQGVQTEPLAATPPPSEILTHISSTPIDPRPVDIDALLLTIDPALDPSLYIPWSLPSVSDSPAGITYQLPPCALTDIHNLLLNNDFRDVLITASRTMLQPPKIPSISSLNRYVSFFIEKFAPHAPIISSNFDREAANPLLLISMASIGALFGVERKTALMLHNISKRLEENLRSTLGHEDYPIWAVQALYLNVVLSLIDAVNEVLRCLEWICQGCPVCSKSYTHFRDGKYLRKPN
jgi:hypothetical protein